MKRFIQIDSGFFSARFNNPNGEVEFFLKLRGTSGGSLLFKVKPGNTFPFGNRWTDTPENEVFYDVQMMDATIQFLRYPDGNRDYSRVTCDVVVVDVHHERPFRMIEV